MPSKNMLPKGKRRHTVKHLYRVHRGLEQEAAALAAERGFDAVAPLEQAVEVAAEEAVPAPVRELPDVPQLAIDPYGPGASAAEHTIAVPAEAKGMRVDQYLARAIPDISRSRVQLLIEHGQVRVNGAAAKARDRLLPGDTIVLVGSPQPAPLAAEAEAIPLEIVYEDESLAIVNKPAGMSVHAGAAATRQGEDAEEEEEGRDPRSAGTLVNALLHHFAGQLSGVGGPLRPGIVHRLDKATSGLLVVAKDDRTHNRLAEAFAERAVEKVYLALVHGELRARGGGAAEEVTVNLPIGRDAVRRTRMTTRRPADAPGVRPAVSHVRVLERLHTKYGEFTLVEVRIETGRTHQIRVHLQALGHPVVGDTVYGAPAQMLPLPVGPQGVWRSRAARPAPVRLEGETLSLPRNYLHAARLRLVHPRTGEPLEASAALPAELLELLGKLGSTKVEELGSVRGRGEELPTAVRSEKKTMRRGAAADAKPKARGRGKPDGGGSR